MQKMVARLLRQNLKLVSASFAKLQFWTERKRVYFMYFKTSSESTLLDLRVLKGGLQVGKSSGSLEQNKIRLQFKSPNWTRMQKRLIHSIFPKNNTGFLHEDEIYTSTDLSKLLEEFVKKHLNRL